MAAPTTDFIAAIELGSSKITGIAGKKLLDGSVQVLALASESSDQCIRNGVIFNLDRTAQSLTSIINRLESTLKAEIGKVYVGVSGQSLRTLLHTQTEHFEEETKITQKNIAPPTIPARINILLSERKISGENKLLISVEIINALSPILSNIQPKNNAANASTAIAKAYKRLNDSFGKALVFAACNVISVKSRNPNANKLIAII